jgi:hypothetical protein
VRLKVHYPAVDKIMVYFNLIIFNEILDPTVGILHICANWGEFFFVDLLFLDLL